jgi:rfaE bifunctional protein kinase chain/domain
MRISDAISAWAGKRALVIGDPMDDIYRFGRVERVSQEAPVPVFVGERTQKRRGGADNVAANLEALGLHVTTYFPERPWTMKLRYMVGHHQLIRVDHDVIAEPNSREVDAIREHLKVRTPDVIVISDYAKGWCSTAMCCAVIAHANCPVVVDPKGTNWNKYARCTLICPNEAEFNAYNRVWRPGDPTTRPIFYKTLEKRGAQGLRLYGLLHEVDTGDGGRAMEQDFEDFPAQALTVFDVTGAGDTVVAVMAATEAANWSPDVGARLANLAAGIVVGEVGTSVCSLDALFDAAWAYDQEHHQVDEPPQHYPPLFKLVD